MSLKLILDLKKKNVIVICVFIVQEVHPLKQIVDHTFIQE